MLMFCFISTISLLWSTQPYIDYVALMFFISIITISIINYTINNEKLELVLMSMILSGVILSIFMLTKVGIMNLINTRFVLDGYNSNDVGLKLSISCLIAIYFIMNKKKIIFSSFSLIIILPFIIFTGSKKAIILLVVGTLIYLILNGDNILKKIKFIFLGIIIIIILFYLMFNVKFIYLQIGSRFETLLNQLFYGSGGSHSDVERMEFIKSGIKLARCNPMFGYGINNFKEVIGQYMSAYTYSHNNYIEILIGLGSVGFILYYSTYYYTIEKLFKLYRLNHSTYSFPIMIIIMMLILEVGLVSYDSVFYPMLISLCYCISNINCYAYKDNRDR